MGHEGAHPQLLGQGEGVPEVAFGLVEIGRIGAGRDLAAQAQGPGLVAAALVLRGEIEGSGSQCGRFASCLDTPTTWSTSLDVVSGRFRPGRATVDVTALACDPVSGVCSDDSVNAVIRLAV